MSCPTEVPCAEPPAAEPPQAEVRPARLARWARPDTLLGGLAAMLVLVAVQRLVGFGRSILFCMWLDPDELGQWDLAYGSLMLLSQVSVISLPSSFSRYAEHYRQRGQLRTFLRRIAVTTAGLALAAAVVLMLFRGHVSQFIFGTAGRGDLVLWLAGGLLAVVGYSVADELLSAMRLQRVASALEFISGISFAAMGVALVLVWRSGAESLLAAYAGSCVLAWLLSLVWIVHVWRAAPPETIRVPQRDFWRKLMPFAAWVWITFWLSNLLGIVDRYMIVHYSGLPTDAALALVGQYYSARIVPALLITCAGMMSRTITPYLSHDWEAGRRYQVISRLNLLLKLTGLGFTGVGVAVLIVAPLVFGWAFGGKLNGGLSVLHWMLVYSAWFGMVSICRAYLWCDEKVRLASLAYLAGLLVNVGANLLLLPRLGLTGAALSACASILVVLLCVAGFAAWRGMRFDRRTCAVAAVPLILCAGPWAALALWLVVLAAGTMSNAFFSATERQQARELMQAGLMRLRRCSAGEPGPVAVAE